VCSQVQLARHAGATFRYGHAAHALERVRSPDLTQRIAEARTSLGTLDMIGHRSAPIPGLARAAEIRVQDPHGPYGAPMLRLVAGRYPIGANEVALTDEVATLTDVGIGGQLTLGDRADALVHRLDTLADISAYQLT
jgi:putative ABC transport system permease protein